VTDQGHSEGATSPGQDSILRRVADLAEDGREHVVTDFARAALRRVPAEQLRAADTDQVAERLVDAFRFADQQGGQGLALRVTTPEASLDPRRSASTVVELHTEDRPFLLATVQEELRARGLETVRALHPIMGVDRDPAGRIAAIRPARSASERESFIHLELDRVLDATERHELEQALQDDARDVFAATGDFDAMRDRIETLAEQLDTEARGLVDDEELEEAVALLEWLVEGNFVFLGLREYGVVQLDPAHPDAPGPAASVVEDSGLGILRDDGTSRYHEPVPLSELPDEQVRRFLSPRLLTVSRTNRVSTVHRRVRMDYIGITRFDEQGDVAGEFRILGLFTRKAFNEPARTTPVLRQKLRRILELEDVVPGSHDESTLISLFQALPKDELFQSDTEALHTLVVDLFHAEEQGDVRVVSRIEDFTRTVSVMIAVPRDRYSAQLRERFTEVLLGAYGGTAVEVDLSLSDRKEAVARFSVTVPDDGPIHDVPASQLQRELRRLTRSWVDVLATSLAERLGQEEGDRLSRTIGGLFGPVYRGTADPRHEAVADVLELDELLRSGQELHVALRPTREGLMRVKAFRRGSPLELSSFLPILEDLGLTIVEELPFDLSDGDPELHIHDFGVRSEPGVSLDPDRDGDRLGVAVAAVWFGQTETDSLHRLVLSAGLDWWQVSVLRAYRRYRRQVGTAYTPEYVNDTLAGHPAVARALVEHFETRFDPEVDAGERDVEASRQAVLDACDSVERLDHDRILRGFLALIDATVRTNLYRPDATVTTPDGRQVPYLSFKLDSSRVPDVPKPVPYREIFVTSPLVEGVHLRGGPVARGGLRWSDRQDDVRTEVLGLMKAQVLKNAVIVPTGAKGGFVLKQPPVDRAELRAEVERQYVTFVRGLLDVTDNLESGEVVPPPGVLRHDGDDPYLVVAADKGTATFSDTANGIAHDYGFWLGDAFASGGSNGYDHKVLGITAAGAWVAVRRHFRELGIDTQSDPITVVGIGDMSGDVFGNGMLSSRTIRLVAAFDHRDIFLDPDPDPAASFDERQRLFTTPGTTWQDFDRDVISDGGGVHSRASKSIELTPQVRELLRVDDEHLSPPELIRAILRAQVDLLWAGGIGTYVKASTESHDAIGDRANDELRVDGDELGARVFGEGANLSITQRGRIQYARRGGRIDQDAIHNAGGVDSSDHEVNVKILLDLAVERGRITTQQRDQLLVDVTDDVVAHVLRDVDLQMAMLSAELDASPGRMDAYERLMVLLETDGPLDRRVEALPTSEEMAERAEQGAGLTRPELATLVGYAKRLLFHDVLESGLARDPAVAPVAATYFPPKLVAELGDLVPEHRLHDELVAMLVANDIVNRMGVTFVLSTAGELGVSRADVLAAYWVAREVAGAADVRDALDGLVDTLAPETLRAVQRDVDRLLADLTRTYLRDPEHVAVAAVVERDRPVFDALRDAMLRTGTPEQRTHRLERAQRLVDDLVEDGLATYLASTRDLLLAPDIAAILRILGADVDRAASVADATLRLGSELSLDRIARTLDAIDADTRWERMQHVGLSADLRELRRSAVLAALRGTPEGQDRDAVRAYLDERAGALQHATTLLDDLDPAVADDLDAPAVVLRALRGALGLT
jgi:glutamate dehydrogenase